MARELLLAAMDLTNIAEDELVRSRTYPGNGSLY